MPLEFDNSRNGKYTSLPTSFLAASIACLTANSAEQLIHIGGSPQAEKQK